MALSGAITGKHLSMEVVETGGFYRFELDKQ